MKKIFSLLMVFFLAFGLAGPALAKPGNKVVKGPVTAINSDGTFAVMNSDNELVLIVAPAGYDLSGLQVGDIVLVKGTLQDDGSVLAEWIKKPGNGKGGGEEDDEKDREEDEREREEEAREREEEALEEAAEEDDETSAYCTGEKETPHPVAARMAERYGVTTEWVMGYFCQGLGMGTIMLALKTSSVNGASADDLLSQRLEGKGWGEIWKELKLIGSERDVSVPPGWLKKGGPKR